MADICCAIDGGGRSVLAQLVIIDKLMHLIQSKKRLDHIPNPCEYADIIIGTGLGGYVKDSVRGLSANSWITGLPLYCWGDCVVLLLRHIMISSSLVSVCS